MKKEISICSNPEECPYGDESPIGKSGEREDDRKVTFHSSNFSPRKSMHESKKRTKEVSVSSNREDSSYGLNRGSPRKILAYQPSKSPAPMKPKQRHHNQYEGLSPTVSSRNPTSNRNPTSVYYPANSPLNHLPRKVSTKKRVQEAFKASVKTGLIVAVLLLLAVIFYAVLFDIVATVRDDVKELKAMVRNLQNSSLTYDDNAWK